ncbi:MAG: Asp-tRNA(Asn)/Glu-tRNA(Gln) amidotransferase subunit GatC [Thermodesulfobacteriota bacterium]|nr:Asp-tRNA(Asn)/Glu-tRNA(Gln) amidotransferase subunit GatC [Thermodesulfobacteriota bacterium]
MQISQEEILQVAKLARLEMRGDELKNMTEQLDRILSYIAKLKELNTDGVTPTTHALAINNAFREDTVKDSLPRQEALANAPEQNGESFVVPKVI